MLIKSVIRDAFNMQRQSLLVKYPEICQVKDSEGCKYYFSYGKRKEENATKMFVVLKKGIIKGIEITHIPLREITLKREYKRKVYLKQYIMSCANHS